MNIGGIIGKSKVHSQSVKERLARTAAKMYLKYEKEINMSRSQWEASVCSVWINVSQVLV